MKKWNTILMIFFLTGIIFSVSVHTISAYLADSDTASNPIVVGGNRITIDEEFDPKSIVPDALIKKKVRIHNEGPNDCYVRVRAVFSNSDVGSYATVDWNTADWVYNSEDEFYYYKVPIEMNEHTSYLMTQIKISKDIPAHCVKDAELIVYAESYQAEGFSNYQEAWENYQLNLKRIKR